MFPLLRGMVNFHRRHLFELPSDSGGPPTLHLRHSASPEYPRQNADGIDTNFDVALLEWGLRTLLWIDDHLDLGSPERSAWEDEVTRSVRWVGGKFWIAACVAQSGYSRSSYELLVN